MKVKSESEVAGSCLDSSGTPKTAAHQVPQSMGFSRQNYWSGVPLPSPNNCITFKLIQDKNVGIDKIDFVLTIVEAEYIGIYYAFYFCIYLETFHSKCII